MNKHFILTSILLFVILALIILKAIDNFEITQLNLDLENCQEAVKICVDIANKP